MSYGGDGHWIGHSARVTMAVNEQSRKAELEAELKQPRHEQWRPRRGLLQRVLRWVRGG